MAITNHERVGKALDCSRRGSRPSSSGSSRIATTAQALVEAQRFVTASGSSQPADDAPWDVAVLLAPDVERTGTTSFARRSARPSAGWSASCATCATAGRTRSRSPATTPTARSTRRRGC